MNPFQLKKFLKNNDIKTTRKNMFVYSQCLKMKDFLDSHPNSTPAIMIDFYIRNFGFFKITHNQNNDFSEYKNTDSQKIYTGKRIRDHVRYRLSIIISVLNSITRNLKRFQTSKVSPKSDYNNNFAIDSNTSDFFSLIRELKDLHPNLPSPEIKKENIIQQSQEIIKKIFSINRGKIGELLDNVNKFRKKMIYDTCYRYLAKDHGKDKIYLKFKGKAKHLNSSYKIMDLMIKKIIDATWLKESTDNIVSAYIYKANEILAFMITEVEKYKSKPKKTYPHTEDLDFEYVLMTLGQLDNNVLFTLNKLCGLGDIEKRTKLYYKITKDWQIQSFKRLKNYSKKIIDISIPKPKPSLEELKLQKETIVIGFASDTKLIADNDTADIPFVTPEMEKFENIVKLTYHIIFCEFCTSSYHLEGNCLKIIKKEAIKHKVSFDDLKLRVLNHCTEEIRAGRKNIPAKIFDLIHKEMFPQVSYSKPLTEKEKAIIEIQKEVYKQVFNTSDYDMFSERQKLDAYMRIKNRRIEFYEESLKEAS